MLERGFAKELQAPKDAMAAAPKVTEGAMVVGELVVLAEINF
jgi:hypothetical protein